MSAVQELLAAGRPTEALAAAQAEVRQRPQDAKLRTMLFQLLAVTGQWARAAAQLEVCGELDAGTLAMVNTYREALKCELVREAVFEGRTTPMVMGEPAEWVANLVHSLKLAHDGDAAGARQLRAQARWTPRPRHPAPSMARPSTGSVTAIRASVRCWRP